jgi:hypothetical protein
MEIQHNRMLELKSNYADVICGKYAKGGLLYTSQQVRWWNNTKVLIMSKQFLDTFAEPTPVIRCC